MGSLQETVDRIFDEIEAPDANEETFLEVQRLIDEAEGLSREDRRKLLLFAIERSFDEHPDIDAFWGMARENPRIPTPDVDSMLFLGTRLSVLAGKKAFDVNLAALEADVASLLESRFEPVRGETVLADQSETAIDKFLWSEWTLAGKTGGRSYETVLADPEFISEKETLLAIELEYERQKRGETPEFDLNAVFESKPTYQTFLQLDFSDDELVQAFDEVDPDDYVLPINDELFLQGIAFAGIAVEAGQTGGIVQFLEENREQVEADFRETGLDPSEFITWLPNNVLRYERQREDQLPLPAFNEGRFEPAFDNAVVDGDFFMAEMWAGMPPETQVLVRRELYNHVRRLMGNQGLSRSEAIESLSFDNLVAIASDGILAQVSEQSNGAAMAEWLAQQPTNLYKQWRRFEGGDPNFGIDSFLDTFSSNRDFNAIREGVDLDQIDADIKLRRAFENNLPPRMADIPAALRDYLLTEMMRQYGGQTPEEVSNNLKGDYIGIFLEQTAVDFLEAMDARAAADYLESGDDIWSYLKDLGLTPTMYTVGSIRRKVQGVFDAKDEAAQVDLDAALTEQIRPFIENLPDQLAGNALVSLQNRLRQLAEVEGVPIDQIVSARDVGALLDAEIKTLIEGTEFERQIELLAELNTGGSITELFSLVDSTGLTLNELLEEVAALEPRDAPIGDVELEEQFRELAEIRRRAEIGERAEKVQEDLRFRDEMFLQSKEGQRLAEDQRLAAIEQQRREVERIFVDQPFGEGLEAAVGRFFAGRNRRAIISRIGEDAQRDFAARIRGIQEGTIDSGVAGSSGSRPVQEIVDLELPQFLAQFDRDTLLGNLREAQAEQRVVFSAPARRRQQPLLGGR